MPYLYLGLIKEREMANPTLLRLSRGKKDGLSKEGSGRVAIYKATGLIKCYTLECNYNTGRYVNVLPARGKDKAPRAVNLVPPKYTPAHFEEVSDASLPDEEW